MYKIRDSVDIYVIPKNDELVELQFYKINTREKLNIEVDRRVCEILPKIDGKTSIKEILNSVSIDFDEVDIRSFLDLLVGRGYVRNNYEQLSRGKIDNDRFDRQINYFDDLVSFQDGFSTQNDLQSKHVFVLGCGAIGASIAILLARAGVKKFTLIDYKKISESSISRHLYANIKNIGEYKTKALSEYIKRIDESILVQTTDMMFLPTTDTLSIINDDVDIVVNSADEPYIGHTTLKLGRELWNRNIAVYAAGGFDAHSMSTGELIAKGLTPCADCYSNTFQKALKDWKPTYAEPNAQKSVSDITITSNNIGGPGGLCSQALFSSSFAAINIVDYLIKKNKTKSMIARRGEFLPNQGVMTWVELKTQGECNVCKS